jgi:hypothetical protein
MRIQPLLKGFSVCAAALLLAGAAFADEVVYPAGSRIGLVPPKGFTASPAFRGFVDMENKAIIVLFELPPAAFEEMEKANSVDEIKKHGLLVDKREEISIAGGKGFLLSGREEAGGVKSLKWLLFAPAGDFTAAVNVQVPEAAKDVHPDSTIRAALASLKARPTPIEEQLALLPFRVENLAGMKIVKTAENRTLVLADDPNDGNDKLQGAHMIIGAASAPAVPANERGNVSREALAGLPGFKDMKITFAEPMRLGGQQAFEMRVDAKHVPSGADVSIVQWMRFGTGGVLRIVGVAPKEKWADTFPRFRTVRDAVNLH